MIDLLVYFVTSATSGWFLGKSAASYASMRTLNHRGLHDLADERLNDFYLFSFISATSFAFVFFVF